MAKNLALLLLFTFSFSACNMLEKKDTSAGIKKKKKLAEDDEDGESIKQKKKSATFDYDTRTNSDAEILNNIIVHESGGLKVSRAFLSFEDGSLVTKTNRTELGKPVYLNLLVKSGWKVDDGTVSIDASEKIVTDAGEDVLNATNLFKKTPKLRKEDANYIYLEAAITKTRKDINYFIVNFHVWDKMGEGEIKGNFKLFIDKATE